MPAFRRRHEPYPSGIRLYPETKWPNFAKENGETYEAAFLHSSQAGLGN